MYLLVRISVKVLMSDFKISKCKLSYSKWSLGQNIQNRSFPKTCGQIQSIVDGKSSSGIMVQASKSNRLEEITDESLGLQHLCPALVEYFAARMISENTLRRNSVKQRKRRTDEFVIAFTYRRDGKLVNCKYRDVNRKFWQEKGREKIFYGLDDKKGATDIIIVEGEMDKLSLEEAGFRNCISVPDGAPPPVPFQTKTYHLNNRTQGFNIFGTAKTISSRCWLVRWPKKNREEIFKDANEVLTYLGPNVLRETIQNAEEYPTKKSIIVNESYLQKLSVADGKSSTGIMVQARKPNRLEETTEESLGLQHLCPALVEYFATRMISEDTLRRNSVKQRKRWWLDEVHNYSVFPFVIAFTYRRDGKLMNCKYRAVKSVKRKFWQEKGCEKLFYGLDDIKGATDIIIVEGEMDKLSLEEAGFRNCISVPDGTPRAVSDKEIPPEHQDTRYQYIWNHKDYLNRATRIILATDGDKPGQALAEELARRLGRERCWRVRWPMKNREENFKDANEVLMHLGPDVLRGNNSKCGEISYERIIQL